MHLAGKVDGICVICFIRLVCFVLLCYEEEEKKKRRNRKTRTRTTKRRAKSKQATQKLKLYKVYKIMGVLILFVCMGSYTRDKVTRSV